MSKDAGTTTTPVLDWHGCYREGWKGLIGDDSFTHPAKFAPGLVRRIFAHGLERGYWRAGSVIGDPFGGIGGGGVVAAGMGLRWRGVELEPRFVEMARANFGMHQAAWIACGCPLPDITQGDSRRFAEIVGACCGSVTSPPFLHARSNTTNSVAGDVPTRHDPEEMGSTPGQINDLPEGDIDGVVTSPPYADSVNSHQHGIDWSKVGPATKHRKRGPGTKHEETFRKQLNYGAEPGQIGKLPEGAVDGCVTSPPYEASNQNYADGWKSIDKEMAVHKRKTRQQQAEYGEQAGQIGNEAAETYWQAMHQVYAQVYQSLKPGGEPVPDASGRTLGGVLCVVVKDFIRGGQRVPLCDRTMTLLESLGFIPLERARAWLVSETRETGLLGEIVTTRSRKSFFRRLAEKKGSPAIDWEEVLFVRTGTEAKTP